MIREDLCVLVANTMGIGRHKMRSVGVVIPLEDVYAGPGYLKRS